MDVQEEGLSRKRPRLDGMTPDGDDAPQAEDPTPMVQDAIIVRDEEYYRMDGDCVILVGGVLFKVHRFLLERDLSAFANMFSMPQGETALPHALTDENPLVLHDDIDDFRALCWIIYALPTVYQEQNSESTANITKLVSLFMIVHKYHFESHEKWARDLLKAHLRQTSCSVVHDYLVSCPSQRMENLMRVAHTVEAFSLQKSVRIAWLYRLKQNPKETLTNALRVAEELQDRTFQADIYYAELIRTQVLIAPGSTACVSAPTDLLPHQKLALYQGFWSLKNYWEHTLRSCLRKRFTCPPTHICNQEWKRIWRDYRTKMLEISFDPLKVLTGMESELEALLASSDTSVVCACDHINTLVEALEDTLDDHFLGPEPES